MKETPEKLGKIIEKVRGCRFCTNWRHTSEQCSMQRKFMCMKLAGSDVCGKEHHSSLHGSKSQYCKSMSVNVQTRRRSSKKRPVRTGACSMFALYSVPARAPFNTTESCALVMEDPGARHNFGTHAFTEPMSLPSRLLALSLKVLGNKMIKQYTKEYNLILKDMHGTRHSLTAVGLGSIAEIKQAPKVKLFRRMFPNSSKT